MPSREIEEFARCLVKTVRDSAIKACDMNVRSDASYPAAKRWKSLLSDQKGKILSDIIIPDIVDETVFSLLSAIDDGALSILYLTSNGTVINLADDGYGELAGWYIGSGGWRSLYSEERVIDDFSDLTDPQEGKIAETEKRIADHRENRHKREPKS